MKYIGTNFSLTLGAWRIRFLFVIEDEPEDRTAVMQEAARRPERMRVHSR